MPKGRGKETVRDVMHKFKHHTLKSGSGHRVTSRDQAIAIAMHESGMSSRKPKKGKH